MSLEHGDLTEKVIGAAFEVHRVLGYGFLEKVYQRAMHLELERRGCQSEAEASVRVHYKECMVGDYRVDLLVGGSVVVELKVAKAYNPEDEAQLLNLLKATGHRVGLLVNFGRQKVEFKRFVF